MHGRGANANTRISLVLASCSIRECYSALRAVTRGRPGRHPCHPRTTHRHQPGASLSGTYSDRARCRARGSCMARMTPATPAVSAIVGDLPDTKIW